MSVYTRIVTTPVSFTNNIHPRYLYYQIFGIDACFRFKRRQISSYARDPELGPGYAYLVSWDSYNEYLSRFTDQDEVCLVASLLSAGLTDILD